MISRLLVSVALTLLACLWVSLFLWRKTFSYITVGPLYIIEFVMLLTVGAFAAYVVISPDLSFRIPRNRLLQMALWSACSFVMYSALRAALSPSVAAIGLIPGLYPLYMVFVAVVAGNASSKLLSRVALVFTSFYFLAPAVSYLNNYLTRIGLIDTLQSPGWTYVYAVTLAMSLVLVRNSILSAALFGVYFVFALFLFQRGAFVAFAVACLFLAIGAGWRDRTRVWRWQIVRASLVGAIGILAAPVVFDILASSERARFSVTSQNFLQFFLSIFGEESGLRGVAGSREHRIDMWLTIVGKVFGSIPTALFGFGFAGEVGDAVGVSFRAPHNGFVTILYRGGVVGLSLYVITLAYLLRFFGSALRRAATAPILRAHAATGLIILGAFVGDAMTGTILDSPFTSMLFYVQIGIVAVIVSRKFSPQRHGPIRLAPASVCSAAGGP